MVDKDVLLRSACWQYRMSLAVIVQNKPAEIWGKKKTWDFNVHVCESLHKQTVP